MDGTGRICATCEDEDNMKPSKSALALENMAPLQNCLHLNRGVSITMNTSWEMMGNYPLAQNLSWKGR
jgi:hypothetical protein